jgi:4a-hydroxytetrahydrobiopterin dehydratase
VSSLDLMRCAPYRPRERALTREQVEEYLPQVPQWSLESHNGVRRLQRSFSFADFAGALEFTRRLGELAETEGHHPSILTEWGKVRVTWWTTRVKGLHKNDFIMASKTDRLYRELRSPDED